MKFICIGRNYISHIKELNNEIPEEPQIFIKSETAALPSGEKFIIPSFSTNLQYECEIILKISKTGKNIPESDADEFFKEISLGIDFTARDWQSKLIAQKMSWEIAKGFDHSAATGKFISKHSIQNLTNFDFHLQINGQIVQKGNPNDLLFNFNKIISYASQFFTLQTGDIIFTGTPMGVGKVNNGDLLEGFIENLKVLEVVVI